MRPILALTLPEYEEAYGQLNPDTVHENLLRLCKRLKISLPPSELLEVALVHTRPQRIALVRFQNQAEKDLFTGLQLRVFHSS